MTAVAQEKTFAASPAHFPTIRRGAPVAKIADDTGATGSSQAMDRRRIPVHAVIGIERQRRRLYPDDPAAGRAHFLAISAPGAILPGSQAGFWLNCIFWWS